MVLAQDMPYDHFKKTIQNIMDKAGRIPILFDDNILKFTFSAGCVTYTPSCLHARDFIAQACQRLRVSRESGASSLNC